MGAKVMVSKAWLGSNDLWRSNLIEYIIYDPETGNEGDLNENEVDMLKNLGNFLMRAQTYWKERTWQTMRVTIGKQNEL